MKVACRPEKATLEPGLSVGYTSGCWPGPAKICFPQNKKLRHKRWAQASIYNWVIRFVYSIVRLQGKFYVSMIFTESEFLQVKQFVCLSVANKLRIPDAEFKTIGDLQAQIFIANQSLAGTLTAFLSAYDAWYQFHLRIDAAGKAGKLDGAETVELVRLVQERDSTRSCLINGLASAVV